MAFEPVPPAIRVEPQQIGNESFVVRQVQEALGAPLRVYLNSMVIVGEEPTVIDTGTAVNRRQWLDDVFGLVDPADVRYVFVSHDDSDHTGNLAEVMELCPNATLLASWALVERHTHAFDFPLARCRWVEPGDTLDLADRRLRFVRPPVWDSPATRAVFDERTGVFWAADAFATPVTPALEATTDELDGEFWRHGVEMFAFHALSPWLTLVDPGRFAAATDAVRDLGMTTIASAHSPVVTDRGIDAAFDLVRRLPGVVPPPAPDQQALDAIVGALAAV